MKEKIYHCAASLRAARLPTFRDLKSSVAARSFRFLRETNGSVTVFTLCLFSVMLLMSGMAVDLMRYEAVRAQVQSTLDRAVLAAADMEQDLDPKSVVQDYFDKAGLSNLIIETKVEEGLNFRTVYAQTTAGVESLFLQMAGIDMLVAPAAGIADERISNVEISLVLDVSGSMNSNSGQVNLKVAAKEFVNTVIDSANVSDPNVQDLTHVSIVPFATHVVVGEDLLSEFNATQEHTSSSCVDFDAGDFNSVAVTTAQSLQRAGHFDPWYYSRGVSGYDQSDWYTPVCHTESSREILPFSNNVTALENHIDSFFADGKTSIEIGTKWGAALLDPAVRTVFSNYIADGNSDSDFEGRPLDYPTETLDLDGGDEIETVAKILIVMSDGENTETYELKDEYRSGYSDLYWDELNDDFSIFDQDREDDGLPPYFHTDTRTWHDEPDGEWDGDSDVHLTWPQVWANMSQRYMAYNTYYRVDYVADDYYDYRYGTYDNIGASTKNTRTQAICQAARDAKIVIYTIGFETNAAGDATLRDCATDDAYFFEAVSDCDSAGVGERCIREVFATIAGQINQLKLIN